ncbi:hypothetical protein OJF2_51330 [Aquisphaera giovannonii]|uniref:Uncharacterized protein n=1 Tax=Aquisphaera giovannonii TaxID=406548 RepID=A0A5B9W8R3_9BACT|nr:hypothetical protein OJF2_51330 [Aquisphaera giovannonii]
MHGQGNSFLDGLLNPTGPKPGTGTGPDAEDSELPAPGSPYLAHARAANKPVYALHCLLGAQGVKSFEYVQKDSHSEFLASDQGQVIRLRFAGTKIWEVTIGGLNLWRLYDLIGQHRMPWIRQSDRGFPAGKDGETLIQAIAIKEIEREQ